MRKKVLEELDSTHSIIHFLNPYVVVIGHFASCSVAVPKVMANPEVGATVSTPLILLPEDGVRSAPAVLGATGGVGGWVADSGPAVRGQVTRAALPVSRTPPPR